MFFGEIMKKRRSYFLIYILMVYAVFSISGCTATANYEGKDLVDKAKALHTGLEAAHITVDDIRGGHYADRPPVQEIWYRFVGDVMQYMYIGRDLETGEEYYEYNNGTELDTWRTGDTAWTGTAKGSEGYYNYSRAKRHYFADGGQLLDDHSSAVKSARVQSEAGGIKSVRIAYDDGKIAQNDQMSGVTGYEQEYWIDTVIRDGVCYTLNVWYEKDGKEYSYEIGIGSRDPADPIERIEPPALTETSEAAQ